MSFNIDNFGSDVSNVKSILGGVCYYRYYNKDNNDVTVAGYFPASLGLQVGDRITVIPQTKTDADELYIVSDITNRVVTVTYIDTDGAVDSVNSKTGHVVLDASDVGAIAQLSTIPTASADNLGDIVQFVGTTDANYTNGYFYKCTGAGEPVVYSWTRVDVQPAPDALPSQSGQSGKFLTTDGTNASWSDKPLQNTATGSWSLTIGSTNATSNNSAINIGAFSQASDSEVVVVGTTATANRHGVAIGSSAKSQFSGTDFSSSDWTIAIGYNAQAFAKRAIQLGAGTNSDANTLKVSNTNGNFELMNANGNIPADRIASTTGLADGNYKPRLTISGGVATITWVAE